jgi:hypothetical protein
MSIDPNEERNARESRNAAFTGLGVSLVWLGMVTAFCYWLAVK